jgi:hypothetical protein
MKYILYYLFFILIVFIFAYINSIHIPDENHDEKKEGFTPAIRKIYRPHLRNLRIGTEGLYNKSRLYATNLFRKLGIL